jgi:hypothetical protein
VYSVNGSNWTTFSMRQHAETTGCRFNYTRSRMQKVAIQLIVVPEARRNR